MIAHVVLLKPRADLTLEDRRRLVAAFEHAARAIPTVVGVRLGNRVTFGATYEATSPDAADFMVIVEFHDLSGLQEYLRHPAHEELGARFGESLSAAMVYDFDVGGIERLERLG